jgi:acyl-CoA thioester hydrolase
MKVPIQIRFADIDMMGIAHNAIYFHYFEQARLQYFAHFLGTNWDWQKKGFIVASNSIDYKIPLVLTDRPFIEIKVEAIGTKSFELSYLVTTGKDHDKLHATGKTVMVAMNNIEKKTIELPVELRQALESNL